MLSGSPARRSGPDSGTGPYADRIRAQVAQDAGTRSLGGGSIRRAATICSKTPLPPVASPGPGGCRPRAGRATAAWSAGLHRVVLARRASRRRLSGIPDPGAPGSARQRSSVARPPAEPPTQQRRGPSPGASRSSAHPFVLDHDLYHRGPRGGPDPAQAGAHTSASYGLLAPHARLTPPQYQRKSPLAHPQPGKASGVRTDSYPSTLPTPWRHPQPVNSIYSKTSHLIYERWTTEFIKWCRHRSFRVAPVVLY